MNAPRSVLVVSHVAVTWGAQRRILDLGPKLLEDGYRLTLACPPGELADLWAGLGLPVIELVLPEHRGMRNADGGRPGPGAAARELSAVGRSAHRISRIARSFDLVHSHTLFAHLETALAGRLARRPVVLDLHDIAVPGMGRRVLSLAARLATLTIANSQATAATVGAGPRVDVVHPGVDVSRFRPAHPNRAVRTELSADPDAALVGILGRIDPEKGVDVLVEAMSRIDPGSGPAPCLVVVGRAWGADQDFIEGLRARAEATLGARVRFLPPRPDPEVVLQQLDVLVNASRCEPFGRTVLEAQACAVAVVGTAAGGIPEFVDPGRTGLLVPPDDPDELARALSTLVTDASLRGRLAEAGAAEAAHLSVDAQVRKVAASYGAAIETRSGR
jgi:glycosyltransferase involved in cell wall biosynthesis